MIRATFNPDAKGRYLQGIPARDLTEDEYRALSNTQRAHVRGSSLYEVKTDKEMAELSKPPPKPKPERAAPVPDAPTEQED